MNFLHRKDPHFVVYHYYKFIDLSDTNLIHYCRDKSGNFIPNRMLENLATDPSSYFVNRPNTINAIVLFGSLIFIGVTAFAYYKVYCEKKRIALEEKFYVKINHISNNVTLKSNESQIGNAIIEFKNTSSEIKDIYWDSSRILLHEKIEKQNLILYLKIKLIDSKKKSFKSPLEKITDCLNENFFTFIDNFVNLDFFYYIPALLLIVAMLPTVYYYFLLYKSNVKT